MHRRLARTRSRLALISIVCVVATVTFVPMASAIPTTSVSAGLDHTCAVTSGGGVRCWGANGRGQLGNGTTTASPSPVNVAGLSSDVAAVSAGAQSTCALTTSSGVVCWGNRARTGNDAAVDAMTPVQPLGLSSGVSALSVGYDHACALMVDATVRCWGNNGQGSLGDGTRAASGVPIVVPGLTEVSAISAGAAHTCALTRSGGVKCWGYNAYGQVGNGVAAPTPDGDVLTPTDVVGLTSGVASIAAGGYHTCAMTNDGTTMCWGQNMSGQVGDGSETNRTAPVPVSAPSGAFTAIRPGEFHTCAIKIDGGVACWGNNNGGALGTGDTTERLVPTDVIGAASGTAALDGGRWDTCRVDASGRTSCWGWNVFGQLGNGTTSASVPMPTLVPWFVPSFTASCSGLACTFVDKSSDPDQEIVTRGWTLGDGATATGSSASRTYASGGDYTVVLTATDAAGASAQATMQIAVTAWNLRASVSKVRNVTSVNLTWNRSATSALVVDVLRNGARIATTSNTGAFSHTAIKGTATYVVCPAGDARCSNAVSVKV